MTTAPGEQHVYGYIRVSTTDQVETGLSIQAQGDKIKAYCVMHELGDFRSFVEPGASAKNLERPRLQEIMRDILAGKVSHLIVAKLDRLTRSIGDLDDLVRIFHKHRVTFVSVAESLDTTSATGLLVTNILAAVAQWERQIIGERTREALAVKRGNGERVSGEPPFGYRFADTVPGPWSDENPRRQVLVMDNREQLVIDRVRALRELGQSYRQISATLAEAGVFGRTGEPLSVKTIRQILSMKVVEGALCRSCGGWKRDPDREKLCPACEREEELAL